MLSLIKFFLLIKKEKKKYIVLLHQSLCSPQPFPFFLCFSMGTSKFFIESKYFEFILESGGSFFMLRVVERDKGYYQLIILGRNEAFWLLLTTDDGSRLENNLGYLRKSREPQRTLWGQRCSNFLGRYLAIKELNCGGRGRSILILEGKNSWGWGGFVKTPKIALLPPLSFVLSLRIVF
jgi:hypothetical protein